MAEECTCVELKAQIVALNAEFSSYKEFMEERDRRYTERAKSQQEAIIKAEIATESRLKNLNELRQVVEDLAKGYALKEAVKLTFDAMETKIVALKEIVDASISRHGGVKEAIGWVVGGIGTLLAAMAIYFHR